jgi:RNA polymerase sigma-70 factor (ECF subfamily)
MEPTGSMSDHSQMDRLWRDHARSVWAFAARRVGREAADDIVAQTFVVACRRADQVRVRHPRAWLLGIAANVVRESRRAEDRRAALVDRLARLAPSPTADQDGEGIPHLGSALRSLSDLDLELLLLVAWDDLRIGEAAEVLGLSAGAARTRMLRIRRRLRGRLDVPGPVAGAVGGGTDEEGSGS